MQCLYVAGYMTKCPLTRGVRKGGSTVLLHSMQDSKPLIIIKLGNFEIIDR